MIPKPVPDSAMTVRPVPASLLDRIGWVQCYKFFSRLPQGELLFELPDGSRYRFGSQEAGPGCQLTVKEYRFFRRVLFFGAIGFGKAYTDGDWTSPDLAGLLTLLARHEGGLNDRSLLVSPLGRLVNFSHHLRWTDTLSGSSRKLRAPDELSDAFVARVLNANMTSSAGLFTGPEQSLEQAQRDKLQTIIEKAGISAADHVLEIGCGWGSFAIEVARQTGCQVTGITPSTERLKLARQRVRDAGLEERVRLQLGDYRQIDGRFSKIVSTEMLEAVDQRDLKPFFAACDRALESGGRLVLEVITRPDRNHLAERFSAGWLRQPIFPGGHLPSLSALARALGAGRNLNLKTLEHCGQDYARTLACWRENLRRRRQELLALGYEDSVLRQWEYGLASCQAGFAARRFDLAQLVLDKPADR